jgi:plastocyanin
VTPIRHRKIWKVSLLAIPLAMTAACGGGDGDGDEAAASPSEVVIQLVAFKPEQLEVAAGTTVTWTNRDPGAHTVTSGSVEQGGAGVTQQPDGTFDSGEIAKGDSFEQTFDEPGSYEYFCSLHPATMRGEIRVT